MKGFKKYFFVDVFISFVFTLMLYFILNNFNIKENILLLILVFSYILIFSFSFVLTFFICKLKSKIDYLQSQIEKLNKYDEITDIYKKEFLFGTLKKYFELSKIKECPFSVMIIDIDNFQHINKTFGFEKGNMILKQIGEILKENTNKVDILGKFDSDEFLIAAFCEKEEMQNFAEKIKKLINDFNFEENIRLNISVGITQKQPMDNFSDLLTRAQEAVLLAKKKGGNTIDVLEHFLLIQ